MCSTVLCISLFFFFFHWNCNYTSITTKFLREVVDFKVESSQKYTTAWFHLSTPTPVAGSRDNSLPGLYFEHRVRDAETSYSSRTSLISKKLNTSVQFWTYNWIQNFKENLGQWQILFFCSSTPECFLLEMCFLTSSNLYYCQGSWTVEQKPLGAFLLQLEKNIVGDRISQLDKLKLVRHIHRDLVRFLWEWNSKNSPKNTSIKYCLIHEYIAFIKEQHLH